ncbi:MAG: hypothetical protein ACRDX8_07855 [Acidimicrobiales bacterium]
MPANLPYPTPVTAMEQYTYAYSYELVPAVAGYAPYEAVSTPAEEDHLVTVDLPIIRTLKDKLFGTIGWSFAGTQVVTLAKDHVRVSTCSTLSGDISSTVTQRVQMGPPGVAGPRSFDLVDQGGHWLV